jgi:hypothetical protein
MAKIAEYEYEEGSPLHPDYVAAFTPEAHKEVEPLTDGELWTMFVDAFAGFETTHHTWEVPEDLYKKCPEFTRCLRELVEKESGYGEESCE